MLIILLGRYVPQTSGAVTLQHFLELNLDSLKFKPNEIPSQPQRLFNAHEGKN
jgi:hypothetical protein